MFCPAARTCKFKNEIMGIKFDCTEPVGCVPEKILLGDFILELKHTRKNAKDTKMH